MKNLVVGLLVGAGIGIMAYKMKKKGMLNHVSHDLHKMGHKAKKNIKNFADIAQNEAEYLKDRAESTVSQLKKK